MAINQIKSIYPLQQVAWPSQPENTELPRVIRVLNRVLNKWTQTIEGCRQGVSGPVYNISYVSASRYLTVQDSSLLVDTTAGAVVLTLPLSSSPGFAGHIWTVKWVAGTNPCTIAVTSPDLFETGAGPYTVTPVLNWVGFQCDGSTGFWIL